MSDICVRVLFHLVLSHLGLAQFIVPGLPSKRFVNLTTLNLGVLLSMSSYKDNGFVCTDKLAHRARVHQAQGVEYAINKWNARNKFKLGFVILDDCGSASQTVAQALSFVHVPPACKKHQTAGTSETYDVIGVIGSEHDDQTIALSEMMGPFQIPIFSAWTSSDLLTDMETHSYFLRIIPALKSHFKVISDVIKIFHWTYVSIVHTDSAYDRSSYNELQTQLMKNKICVANNIEIPINADDLQINDVAKSLVEKKNARAVILLLHADLSLRIINSTSDMLPEHFIWIGTDTWTLEFHFFSKICRRMFHSLLFVPFMKFDEEYYNYFHSLKPNLTQNPWFHEFWEDVFKCSITNNSCHSNTLKDILIPKRAGRIIDIVDVYASAIKVKIEECTKSSGIDDRQCIIGSELLRELKRTNLSGNTGNIQINEDGDRIGDFIVYQLGPDVKITNGCSWSTAGVYNFALSELLNMTFKWPNNSTEVPRSTCTLPCKAGEITKPTKDCCWECETCAPYERLVAGNTKCEPCPDKFWPDPGTNLTTCKLKPLATPSWNSMRGLALILTASMSILFSLAMLYFFIRHRHRQVIKNTSPVLSLLILLAICLGSDGVITFQSEPNTFVCMVTYVLISVSFVLLYGSLLLRSLCIFYMFVKGEEESIFRFIINPCHQFLIVMGLLLIQALMYIGMILKSDQWHKITQKQVIDTSVQMSCNIHANHIRFNLIYMLLLIITSILLTCQTRRLEDNFHESAYIMMCVTITFVFWMVFIPAYFMVGKEEDKNLIISLAIITCHVMTLLFIFSPKVYAVLFLEEVCTSNFTGYRSSDGSFLAVAPVRTRTQHSSHLGSISVRPSSFITPQS